LKPGRAGKLRDLLGTRRGEESDSSTIQELLKE
jgi:hypothetical protein